MKEIAISCFDLTENIAKNALIKNKGSNYFDDIEKVDFTNEEVKKEIRAFFEPFGATQINFMKHIFFIIIEKDAFFYYVKRREATLKEILKKALNTLEDDINTSMVQTLEPFSYMLYTINTSFHDCLLLNEEGLNVLSLADYLLYYFKTTKEASKVSLGISSIFEIIK